MNYVEFLAAVRAKSPRQHELPFEVKEYQDRVERLRQEMGKRGFDALILSDPGNMFYFSGYYTFETSLHAALLVPMEGDLALQVHAVEVSNPLIKGWVETIEAYNSNEGRFAVRDQLTRMLEARSLASGRIGIDADNPSLRVNTVREIEAVLPNARFIDATELPLIVRAVKSPREIEYHRKAADITSIGTKAALAAIAPGKTENDIAAVGYAAMTEAGSEFFSIQPVVVSGYRMSFNHTQFYRRRIERGEVVKLEFGGCYNRYTSPIIRQAHTGPPSEKVKRLNACIELTLDAMLEHARAGRTSHEVAVEIAKTTKELHKVGFHYGTYAYAVGAQFPPSWVEGSAYILEGNETVLKPGMVFHTPLGFRLPHEFSVARSETILIREGRCEVLTSVPRGLHIV